MNKKLLAVLVGIGIVIISAFSYVLLMPKDESISKDEVSPKDEASLQNQPPTSAPLHPGRYIDYSSETLASTSGTRLLFFHAPWCPQCREIETDIKSIVLPENLTIIKVDYDSHQTLREQYGVTLQTTFVKIDEKGNKVASYVAYNEPRFSSVQRELLP